MSNNRGTSINHYVHGKFRYSYLSITSAAEALGINKATVSKYLKEGTEYRGHSFKINLRTDPLIVTPALIESISEISFMKLDQNNKVYFINRIVNRVKVLVDTYGDSLITGENIFDVPVVTHEELVDVISKYLEEAYL